MTLLYVVNLLNSITILLLGLIAMSLQKQIKLQSKRADIHSEWLRAVSSAQVKSILGTNFNDKE